MKISALLSFLSVIFWAWVLGATGAILAVPLTVLIRDLAFGPADPPDVGAPQPVTPSTVPMPPEPVQKQDPALDIIPAAEEAAVRQTGADAPAEPAASYQALVDEVPEVSRAADVTVVRMDDPPAPSSGPAMEEARDREDRGE
jgi:hypothetical protein